MRFTARVPALFTCLLLGACASAPQQQVERNFGGPGDDVLHGVDNPQVIALWRDADVARQTRDYTRASVRLEQAIGLEPGNPALWSRLAEIRLLQDESVQAENLAAKSNALVIDNNALRYRNWLIIQYARKRRGDQEGVELAQQELDKLRDPTGE